MAELKYNIGDRVVVSGRIFQSANGTLSTKKLDKKIGFIVKTASTAKHPYAINGITGWFNEEDIKTYIAPPVKVGDMAKPIKNVTYLNKPFKSWYSSYEVLNINGDKATIGKNGNPIAVVNVYNLKKV